MRKLSNICSFLIIILTTTISCIKTEKFNIQNGDLLFQDLDSSPLCEGIEKVTIGVSDMKFSHISHPVVCFPLQDFRYLHNYQHKQE